MGPTIDNICLTYESDKLTVLFIDQNFDDPFPNHPRIYFVGSSIREMESYRFGYMGLGKLHIYIISSTKDSYPIDPTFNLIV